MKIIKVRKENLVSHTRLCSMCNDIFMSFWVTLHWDTKSGEKMPKDFRNRPYCVYVNNTKIRNLCKWKYMSFVVWLIDKQTKSYTRYTCNLHTYNQPSILNGGVMKIIFPDFLDRHTDILLHFKKKSILNILNSFYFRQPS